MRVVDERGAEVNAARRRAGRAAGAAVATALPALARALRRSRGPGQGALGTALGSLGGELSRLPLLGGDARHPLRPAAVRIERARSRGRRGQAEQTAVTVWFGEGPALPSVEPGRTGTQTALRIGAGLLGAAAIAAATGASARLAADTPRPRIAPPAP